MKKKTICCRDFCVIMMTKQVVEFSTNPLNDDVIGCVVFYFRGLQNHTVNNGADLC